MNTENNNSTDSNQTPVKDHDIPAKLQDNLEIINELFSSTEGSKHKNAVSELDHYTAELTQLSNTLKSLKDHSRMQAVLSDIQTCTSNVQRLCNTNNLPLPPAVDVAITYTIQQTARFATLDTSVPYPGIDSEEATLTQHKLQTLAEEHSSILEAGDYFRGVLGTNDLWKKDKREEMLEKDPEEYRKHLLNLKTELAIDEAITQLLEKNLDLSADSIMDMLKMHGLLEFAHKHGYTVPTSIDGIKQLLSAMNTQQLAVHDPQSSLSQHISEYDIQHDNLMEYQNRCKKLSKNIDSMDELRHTKFVETQDVKYAPILSDEVKNTLCTIEVKNKKQQQIISLAEENMTKDKRFDVEQEVRQDEVKAQKNEVQKTNVVVNNDQLLSRCHTEAEKLELENKFHNTAEYLSAFHQELKDEPLLLQDSTTLQSLYKELLILHPDVVPQEDLTSALK